MDRVMSLEEAILEKVRILPLDRQQQMLDFVEFLQSKSSELTVTATIQPETPIANADTPQGKGWPPGFFEETFGSCKDDPLVIDSEGIFEDKENIKHIRDEGRKLVFQDYPESGSVQIGSTLWNWSISEVRSLPEGTVSYANLDFHDPENERNTMCVGLDEPFSPSTVDEIRELGCNPDERKLIAPDGSEWVLNPVRTPPERVSAHRSGRMFGTITLPEGVRLGEMPHSDLLDLLELLP